MSYSTLDAPLSDGVAQIRDVRVSYRGRARTLAAPLTRPDQVAAFMRKLVAGDAREHFVVIHLDGRHRPIGYQVASVGTATASLIHPREVFQQPAIAVGAVAIIISHNHPSGDPTPSSEDNTITKRLADAGNLLGIHLLDHVVCAGSEYHSTRETQPEWFNVK